MHWAEEVAKSAIAERGEKHVLATGITPSGPIHVGNMREVLTADLVNRALKDGGAAVKFLYIADNFDPLRRRYPFLPEKFEEYIGQPLSEIPAPEGSGSYADYYLRPFFDALAELGIEVEKIFADKLYKDGTFTPLITEALRDAQMIAKILEEVTGRKLPEGWLPVEVWCKKCKRGDQSHALSFDEQKHTVAYRCDCGEEGEADYSKGEGKLFWRVDWPARWKLFGVTVEPFGKDHAAAGGSYDSGKRISQVVFNYPPPFPIIYEWINLVGKGAMSSSKGIAIPAKEFLDVVPPEILRYLIAKTKPQRHIDLDPGKGLIQLADEFARLEEHREDDPLYRLSVVRQKGKVIPHVPFRHLVEAVQAAQGDVDEVQRILRRSGHTKETEHEELLKEQMKRVDRWLQGYAPEDVKFTVQKSLPPQARDLTDTQRTYLQSVADQWKEDLDAEKLHGLLFEIIKSQKIDSKSAFRAIYIVLLGRDSGPKAGWFLHLLGRDFVRKRFIEAAKNK